MKYSIVFIVPYYGRFPGYFREWVYSASFLAKENIDFLLITDIEIGFSLPNNIKTLPIRFEEFQQRAQEKFDFKIELTTPYKLCDFKPTLGYIFSEEIKAYDFWGNCDIDQVWGSVRDFITDDIMEKYDRIQFLGHFILYKNIPEINILFMKKGAIYDYRHVLSDPMHYSFCEHSGMMNIVVKNGVSNYLAINYADLSPRYKRMIVSRKKNYDFQIMYWENGFVFRSYIDDDGQVKTEEFMYFHFQRKHPKSLPGWDQGVEPKRIIYRADGFIISEPVLIDTDYIRRYSDFIDREHDAEDERRYKREKIKQFIESSTKKKVLWLKQRLATHFVIKQECYFGKNYSNI